MRSIQMFLTVVLLYAVGLLESVQGQSLACPAVRTSSGWLDLFPLPCKKHAECRSVMGKQHLCCKGFCTKGIAAQRIANDVMGSVVASSTSTTATTTTTSTTTSTTTTTPKPTSTTTTTTTTTAAPRPFFQLLPIQTTQAAVAKKTSKTTSKSQKLVCPKGQSPLVLFPIPCENNAQCRSSSGADHVCCERRCVKGVPAPRPKPAPAPRNHQPLLGVIPRECPSTPLGELLFEVQSCKTDSDCWPRLCCPDGTRSYCRTARARLDLVPVANQIDGPVRMFEQYLQCTAPPKLDLFPRACSSSVDCFPNLCCAEGGKKHCRPPLRSLLALLAGVTQRVGSTLGNLRRGAAQNNNKI